MPGPLSSTQVAQFERDGYLFIEGFLDAEETALLQSACKQDAILQANAMDVRDSQGRAPICRSGIIRAMTSTA